MSLWRSAPPPPAQRAITLPPITAEQLIPVRSVQAGRIGSVNVTRDTALKHSAMWAACRMRADLISTLPCDVYRKVNGLDIEVAKPPVLLAPGGAEWDYVDWMWATQFDMDTCGNAVGLITERFANNLPAKIELQPINCVSIRVKADGSYKWWIDGKEYTPEQVWHEKAFPVPGFVLGLSPVAYAAWTIGEALSMQEFATSWFSNGGVPKAHLRNSERVLGPGEAEIIQARHEATMRTGGVFVTGKDWEYDLVSASQAGTEFIEGRSMGLGDVARFFGVPADLIDASGSGTSGGKIDYANVTQRNLQFLIYHLGPTIIRREKALSKLLPSPRFVKLKADALLRMDPETREKVIRSKLESFQLAVTEARELENRAAFTTAQEAEVEKWFGSAKATNEAAAAQAQPQPSGNNPQGEQ